MAQPRRDDQHLGAANRNMYSLHAEDVSNVNVSLPVTIRFWFHAKGLRRKDHV